MSSNYTTISLPRKLVEKIEEVIGKENSIYSSKTDFIKDAIRIRLRELGINI